MVTPSMLTCFHESLAPFAMIREPSVEVEKSVGSLTRTPGVRAASCANVRPFRGRLTIRSGGDNLAQCSGFGIEQRSGEQ